MNYEIQLNSLIENIFYTEKNNNFYVLNKFSNKILKLDKESFELLKNIINKKMVLGKYKDEIDFFNDFLLTKRPETKCFIPSFFGFRITLTENCNLNCKYCFVKRSKKILKDMNETTLMRVLEYTLKIGKTRSLRFHFFGGEPLIKFNLIKKAVEFLELKYKLGEIKKPSFAITTNGLLINKEITKYLREHNFVVGVSIDGLKEKNDNLRVYYNNKGTFEDIIKGLEMLKEYHIPFYVLMTPYMDNLDKFVLNLEEILKRYPMISTVTINTPMNTDFSWMLPGKKFAELVYEALQVGKKYGVQIESAASLVLFSLSREFPRMSPCVLHGTEVLASVSPEGKISYCSQNWDTESINVSKELTEHPFRLENTKDNGCNKCPAEFLCGGRCFINYKIKTKKDLNRCGFFINFLKIILNKMEDINKLNVKNEFNDFYNYHG